MVVAVGLAITLVAYFTLRRAEERRVIDELNLQADWQAQDLQSRIRLAGQPLIATVTDVETEPQLTAGEFRQFTTAVAAQTHSVASISWAPQVNGTDRATFEATAGFPILENQPDGSRKIAAQRDSYVPILLQNRFDGRPPSLGLNLSVDPVRRRALEAARDTGLPRSIQLPPSLSPVGPTYLILWPVFTSVAVPATVAQRRAQFKGYVVGVFRVIEVLRTALADTPAVPENIRFSLADHQDGRPGTAMFRLMATYSAADHAVRPPAADPAPPAAHASTRSFEVNGQTWRLDSTFLSDTVAAKRSVAPLTILIAGLLLTVVLAYNVAEGIRRVSIVRRLVDERTAELRRTNTQLKALIDASPYAIVCVDAARRVILWNASAQQLFGHTPQEVMGHPSPVIPPGQEQEFDRRFERLAAGEVLRNLASRHRHRDGTLIETSSSSSAFFDAEGRLAGAVFAIEDARERNEVQNQLRQAQKMEAIGQLTGGLAHDFNNLLGVILGNLDLLAERFEPGGEELELTEAAIQASMRGAELIRRLLAFSRRQPLAPKITQVPPLLQSISELLRRTLGENIRLELHVAAASWPVLVDTSQLESTMLNLAVNARDAMPEGGRLTIEASNVVIDERASELNMEASPGDYVLIAVSDTGMGMTPEVLAHVFEPFFTTKGSAGTGLGLSMVHGFIKQSGGYSKIYSEPGRGTTVRLYLPRASEGESFETDTVTLEPLPRGDEMVLVVEDNGPIRELVVRQLESLGYRTLAAANGDQAIEMLRGGALVDLLFTDVVMPGSLDGRALAQAARRMRPGLKVLFTSGFTAAAASAAVEKELGSNLLSKPYRKSELARWVRAALDTV
ncbi:MAG TPA: CHASE domain-containing protein [Steroidobacteraceae bacterium]|nr:CHASE domain-containing protein [Steroidobacteraceae bacterium]